MAENLNYAISNTSTDSSWCYENNSANCSTYGRLYKWSAAKTACPAGWHLPSRDEWGTLAKYAGGTGTYGDGGTAGTKLKAKDGWNSGNGTDDYGFSALPGGDRYYSGSSFYNAGNGGLWWTATDSTVNGSSYAYCRYMSSNYDYVDEDDNAKSYGFSVRCLQDTATYTYTLTVSKNPTSGGTTNISGQSNITAGTQVDISATAAGGYTFNNWTITGSGTLGDANSASTYVTVNGDVTVTANFTQVVYGELNYGGQKYKTVTIGNQTWMAENLNYKPSSGNSWCYNNEDSYCTQYGRLYDWSTAMNVCPIGWYLPTRAEWQTLVRAVDPNAQLSGNWDDDNVAGKKLKSSTGWYEDYGTDDYGFSALPGGFRNYYGGSFGNAGYGGAWWTVTEDSGGSAYDRSMAYHSNDVSEYTANKVNGYSVRCVVGDAVTHTYTLTVNRNPTNGGTTNISGQSNVAARTQVNISATAADDYSFSNWTIAGSGTLGDANSASTYVTINGDVTVTANFTQNIVYGGQKYKTVKIGSQTWMAENLNYKPSSGNSWCYDNEDSYCSQYGRLYDWAMAMGIDTSYNYVFWNGSDNKHQGICPSGWHLPSNAEWTTLVNYAGDYSTAGKKLKATSGWGSSSSYNGTDEYGFSALPGGDYDGNFDGAGNNGYWWTATEGGSDYAYYRYMGNHYENVYEHWYGKGDGRSVRCLQD
jgi:uncharacterized protein (TIGR02145 family)